MGRGHYTVVRFGTERMAELFARAARRRGLDASRDGAEVTVGASEDESLRLLDRWLHNRRRGGNIMFSVVASGPKDCIHQLRQSWEEVEAFISRITEEGAFVMVPELERVIEGGRLTEQQTPCGPVKHLSAPGWQEIKVARNIHVLQGWPDGVKTYAVVTRAGGYGSWMVRLFAASPEGAERLHHLSMLRQARRLRREGGGSFGYLFD